ncbi:MAG: EscU/YscU/HrcU family type III secretion system export apparatus switch protein [Clostridium sp.]
MRKKAAAIKYEKGLSAPIVTAMGFGEVAQKIIDVATDSNIPIVENTDIVDNLTPESIGDNIPNELYEIVAELLAYIYSIEKD